MVARVGPATGEATLKQRYRMTNRWEYDQPAGQWGQHDDLVRRRQHKRQLDALAIGRSGQARAVRGADHPDLAGHRGPASVNVPPDGTADEVANEPVSTRPSRITRHLVAHGWRSR